MTFLEISPNLLINLNAISTVTTLSEMVVGVSILTYFKFWILDIKEYKDKIDFCEAKLVEELAQLHGNLHNRILTTDIPLRGSPPDHPDLLGQLAQKTFSIIRQFNEISILYKRYKLFNSIILIFTVFGLLQFLMQLCFSNLAIYISALSILIIVIELIVIVCMSRNIISLERHERR